MAHQGAYGPVGLGFDQFSPLDDSTTMYRSPATYSQPFPPMDAENGGHRELGTPHVGFEMDQRRPQPRHEGSTETMQSSLFPSRKGTGFEGFEDRPFLQDPLNHIETFYTSNSFVPYKDHSKRQLTHILIGASARWAITFALCGGYVLATILWQRKNAISESQKKMYNTITTGISIALGLNIASAFKDMALNMRWPILAARKRNLVELDLILNADSLTKLAKLVFVTKRPIVIIGCLLWLFINILAQAGIAMLSLTYGFDTDYKNVQMLPGVVAIPRLENFYPTGNNSITPEAISVADAQYTAHMYGEFGYNYGIGPMSTMPKAGDIYNSTGDMLFYNEDVDVSEIEFLFSDSPTGNTLGQFSIYTDRKINTTYACDSYRVTSGGDGTTLSLVVDKLGNITLSETVPDSTTYLTRWPHRCDSGPRCSVVEAFEASKTNPWYYICNITIGETYNDPGNRSFVSNTMAYTATASIAQFGHMTTAQISSVIYPIDSAWGKPRNGDVSKGGIGYIMATYAIASIAGATQFNPYTTYLGLTPSQGVHLHVGHPYFFYLIIGLIGGMHLSFVVVVAVLSNRVMVGPDGHLSMSLLLRPIADALEGVSNGIENKVFRDAKRKTKVIYEKDPRKGRWILNMVG